MIRRPGPALFERAVLLAGLLAFTAVLAPALRESGTPPGWDQSVHLRDSVIYERILRAPSALAGGVLGAIMRGSEDYPLLTPSGYYPPLVPGVTALLYLAAGRSYETAMATMILFLALLLFATRAVGNRLLGGPCGLAAALLLLVAPGIRINASEYMLDLPLAALVLAAVWALLASDGFARTDRSLLFGVLAGAGMLAKWSCFAFLAAPVALAFLAPPGGGPGGAAPVRRRLLNLALAILAAAVVAAPYYLPILPILVRKTIVHAGAAHDGFGSPFTVASALFHLEALPRRLFGWPLTVAAAAGIPVFLRRAGGEARARLFLAAWAASLYLFFTFAVANKQSRYLLPWLPVLLLMTAGGVASLWRPASPRAAEGRAGRGALPARAAAAALALLAVAALPGGWRPETDGDWNLRPLVRRLEEELARRPDLAGRVARLGVIPDMRRVNGPAVAYYAARRDLPVTVVQLVNRMKRHVAVDVGLDPFDREDFYQAFERYDFVVTKDGDNAVPPWEQVVPRMHDYFRERIAAFDRIAAYREPDGSTLALYARRRA